MIDELKYTAEPLESIEMKPGCWEYERIGVFENDVRIGEYVRNYPTMYNTFFPFLRDGKWYALYSPKYTATRVMSLPDCKDLGGDEHGKSAFCPTDYYIPEFYIQVPTAADPMPYDPGKDPDRWMAMPGYVWPIKADHPQYDEFQAEKSKSEGLMKAWDGRNLYQTYFPNWGFESGPYWGGGGSYINFLDLSRAHEGIISRPQRFGDLEMPESCDRLRQAIHIDEPRYADTPLDEIYITIAQPVRYSMDGKRV